MRYLMMCVAILGCDNSPQATNHQYAEKCMLACSKKQGTPCQDRDDSECMQKCGAATEGQTLTCAECIAERSNWHWESCECVGTSCEDCNQYGCSNFTCNPADTECSGFVAAKVSGEDCHDFCL
jgi:hypothetical protein